eukprot:m.212739 g.212739  ORF g.212739 m.212739 type:complete len:169 (+) comp33134_c0_seq4:551-1057(+)
MTLLRQQCTTVKAEVATTTIAKSTSASTPKAAGAALEDIQELWSCVKVLVTSMWLLTDSALDGEVSAVTDYALDCIEMMESVLEVMPRVSECMENPTKFVECVFDLVYAFDPVYKARHCTTAELDNLVAIVAPFIKSATNTLDLCRTVLQTPPKAKLATPSGIATPRH